MSGLSTLRPLLQEVGARFEEAGQSIALVGGPVRDAFLGRLSARTDLDFATSAHPDVILSILDNWAEATWDVGIRFGTVGARISSRDVEITTFRSDTYSPDSRKPEILFGESLEDDLVRRDFTINAMALTLPELTFVDPFGGLEDLSRQILRTPRTAQESFDDDPLRMMRAARFAAQLGVDVASDVVEAMQVNAERIQIVSAERIRDELCKIIMADQPRDGLTILVDTGVAEFVLPELPLLRLEEDEHHHHKDVYEHTLTVLEQAISLESAHSPTCAPDMTLRLAALLHDIGKPRTRRFEKGGQIGRAHV